MVEDYLSSEEEPVENLCDYDNKNLKNLNVKYISVFFLYLI